MLCTVVRGSSDVPTQGGDETLEEKGLAPRFPLWGGKGGAEHQKGHAKR